MSNKVVVRPSAFHTPQRKTRLLLASMPIFAGLLSQDGIVLECNFGPLGPSIDGPSDWIGRSFESGPWWNYSEDSRADILALLNDAKKGKRVSRERLYHRLDGDMGAMILSLVPLFAPYGQPDAILVIAIDVTERRREFDMAEQVAHDMAHRLRNSFTIMRTLATRADDQNDPQVRLSRRMSLVRASHSLAYRYLFFDVPLDDVIRKAAEGSDDIQIIPSEPVSIPSRYIEILLLALGELALSGQNATIRTQKSGNGLTIQWREKASRTHMPEGLTKALLVQGIETETGGRVTLSNNHAGFMWTLQFPLPEGPDISQSKPKRRRKAAS